MKSRSKDRKKSRPENFTNNIYLGTHVNKDWRTCMWPAPIPGVYDISLLECHITFGFIVEMVESLRIVVDNKSRRKGIVVVQIRNALSFKMLSRGLVVCVAVANDPRSMEVTANKISDVRVIFELLCLVLRELCLFGIYSCFSFSITGSSNI